MSRSLGEQLAARIAGMPLLHRIALILVALLAFATNVVGDWNSTLQVSLGTVQHIGADSAEKLTVTIDRIDPARHENSLQRREIKATTSLMPCPPPLAA